MSRSSRVVTPLGRLAAAAAIASLACGVTACEAGTNAPTLNFHPQSVGVDTVVHGIRIIDAFVLGAPTGPLAKGQSAGVFLALYVQGGSDKLVGVSAPGVAKSAVIPPGGVSLRNQQAVYLTGPKPAIFLTGLIRPLPSGGAVNVTFSFMNAGSVTVSLPVIPRSDYYVTLAPAPSPSASSGKHGTVGSAPASATATPSGKAGATGKAGASPSPSPSA